LRVGVDDHRGQKHPQGNKTTRAQAPRGWLPRENGKLLVNDFQAKLDDARLEGTGNGATAGGIVNAGCGGERSAQTACRQVKVGVVENVVEFGAELDLQALDRGIEALVEVKVGFEESGRAAGVARALPNGLNRLPLASLVAGSVKALRLTY